jgi:hypothetical protein
MSSLQKFHRRTNNVPSGPVTWPASAIGMGDEAHGYWLGGASSNKLVVAPKSTEVQRTWGSSGTVRAATFVNNGLANTNTLASFGSAAHPAAYYAKNLSTCGYNTWYLPAKNEMTTLYSNKSATPFATANSFTNQAYWSSNDGTTTTSWCRYLATASGGYDTNKTQTRDIRAVRRSTI